MDACIAPHLESMADTAIPVSAESWLHERYQKADLRALMKLVAAEKRTGQLTIHFGQGAITAVEWKQRAPRTTVSSRDM